LNKKPDITLSSAIHREQPVVKVEFAWNRELIDDLKARTNARWSANMNCWYIPKDKFVLGEFFFGYYSDIEPENITAQHITSFNSEFILKNKLSATFQNQTISALKKFYTWSSSRKIEIESIERLRKSRPVPKVIPLEIVKEMLASISNPKHKLALSTIYGLGLRRSELLNLKLSAIDFHRKTVTVYNSKGKKDRVLPLPEKLEKMMADYIRQKQPQTWLIESTVKGKPYSATSLQNIFEKYMNDFDI
jgi:integrase/recombinase XerD